VQAVAFFPSGRIYLPGCQPEIFAEHERIPLAGFSACGGAPRGAAQPHPPPGAAAGFGDFAFLDGSALRWLVGGGYRALDDRALSGLATPARIAMWVIWAGLGMAGLLWLYSLVLK